MDVLDYISVVGPAMAITAGAFGWIIKLKTEITDLAKSIEALADDLKELKAKTERQDENIKATEIAQAEIKARSEAQERNQ